MQLRILSSINEVDTADWNRLAGTDHPFLRYEFLSALERHDCVGETHGWLPRHLVALNETGNLAGAVPLYVKDNSYGEFVFDWAWADAYARQGLAYYPKSVSAIPYTPASGPRLLLDASASRQDTAVQLIELARQWSMDQEMSSLHWLFTTPADTALLESRGYLLRLGCQFHWHNRGYRDFDDFLDSLTARKRKKIRRERRYVQEQGITIRSITGQKASDELIQQMFHFYRLTFDRKWGHATLTLPFFRDIARSMGDQLVFFVASLDGRTLAGAICFRSATTLYGRHWGCLEDFHSLHFETCYYQGIEYCIREGLQCFEPGAQGEHKISRGFMPTPTWSAHWIAHEGFRDAIGRYLVEETAGMREYIEELTDRSPYRQTSTA